MFYWANKIHMTKKTVKTPPNNSPAPQCPMPQPVSLTKGELVLIGILGSKLFKDIA